MWTVVRVQDTDVLRAVLDQWKAGIDAHDPQHVAEVFTEDAIFQGLRPYSVGRDGIATYYDGQPLGMTVSYRVLETRSPTEELAARLRSRRLRLSRQGHGDIEPWGGGHVHRRRLAHPALPGVARRLTQRGDDLAFEQLDARAVVCGLREVQDRVLTAEVAQPLQLLDDLLGRATGGVR